MRMPSTAVYNKLGNSETKNTLRADRAQCHRVSGKKALPNLVATKLLQRGRTLQAFRPPARSSRAPRDIKMRIIFPRRGWRRLPDNACKECILSSITNNCSCPGNPAARAASNMNVTMSTPPGGPRTHR